MPVLTDKTVIMDSEGIRRALTRISHEIVERNKGVDNIVIVGIRTRGVPIAERIAANIEHIEGKKPPVGVLDITLYRDDLSSLSYQPIVHQTELPVDITDKTIVLVDDVLYTGSSSYTADITDEQMAWLEQDLKYVPKDKLIIIGLHIATSRRNRPTSHVADYKELYAVPAAMRSKRSRATGSGTGTIKALLSRANTRCTSTAPARRFPKNTATASS